MHARSSSATQGCGTRWSIGFVRAGRPSRSPAGSGPSPRRRTGCATRRSTGSSTPAKARARSWRGTCRSGAGAAGRGSPGSPEAPCSLTTWRSGTAPRPSGAAPSSGRWECDLMIFRKEHGAANVATAVARTTRHTVLFRNDDRRSKPIMGRLVDALAPLPADARRSLTFDRGLEVVAWRELDAGLGAKAWLGRPPGPLAEAHGREHQRPPPAPYAEGHRRAVAVGPGPRGDPRPPQRHAPQVPRMAHPCRGDPRPPHGAATDRLIPCPGSPSHFG